jgi:hypothetical protein
MDSKIFLERLGDLIKEARDSGVPATVVYRALDELRDVFKPAAGREAQEAIDGLKRD